MKANKFFAIAMAAIALVGCGPKEEPTKEDLKLDKTSLSLKIGQEETVAANVAVEFTISDEKVASLTPANDGKSVKVKGLAKGSAFLTAKTADGQTKTCAVAVADDTPVGPAVLKGSQIWPVILDGDVYEANADKMVADFRIDDTEKFLYIWEDTYIAGEAKGKGFYGGGFTSLTVSGAAGWSGFGVFINDSYKTAYDALCKAIAADPDNYYMHVAIKSISEPAHLMYAFNETANAAWALGGDFEDNGTTFKSAADFTRDGEWNELDLSLAPFAAKLATVEMKPGKDGKVGANIVCFLSGGVKGTQLDVDAIYIYKK